MYNNNNKILDSDVFANKKMNIKLKKLIKYSMKKATTATTISKKQSFK